MTHNNVTPHFHECVKVFGDSWTLLIVSQLLEGDKRFNELSRVLDGISPTTLSDRLKRLEKFCIIGRITHGDDKQAVTYSLTKGGQAMRPVIQEIYRYADNYFPHD